MSNFGERKDVVRVPDATDRNVPPGAADPKVRLPAHLLTPEEWVRATPLAIVGGNGGLVETTAGCIGSDTRSSMEEYWRRRPVILGAMGIIGAVDAPATFWRNLFAGRDPTTPRPDAVPVPPGWRCPPWRKDAAPVSMPAGGIIQRHEGWWRICTPPSKPAAAPPPKKPSARLRPPTPQTPRPAPNALPRPKTFPTKVKPGLPLGKRPTGCGPWMRTPVPGAPPPGDPAGTRIETRTAQGGRSAGLVEWRKCSPKQAKPSKPTQKEIDAEEVMAWLMGQEALAQELAAQPPDVRHAVLVENPEVLYVWILLGWIEVDDDVRRAFEVLSAELAEIGLSLWDFEEASRADLPPAVAKELKATPLGLATLIQPVPSSSAPVAGRWDAETGIFLPTDPNTLQRPTYGYTPQEPREPSGTLASQVPATPADLVISGCGCEARPPRIGGPLTVRDGDRGLELEHAPCPTRVGSLEDPRCCPECAWENLGPTARAWCAGIASPAARVGDAWADFGRGFAAADRWLSDNVWENVKGVVPYGNVIDAAHQTRMRALEAAAPDFYPSRGTRGGASSRPTKGAAAKGAGTGAASSRTERAITDAIRLSDGVKAGDAGTIATVKRIKDRAVTGDPEARRTWRVYVLVARDVHG